MNRIEEVSKVINIKTEIKTLLDVGCRDCILQKYISPNIKYVGLDLFQNIENTVSIIGDINSTNISDESYDCVVAIDILEHIDDPYTVFNKLAKITKKYLIINLPNGYDLKSRKMFLTGHLSEKYAFKTENNYDRHRWIMAYNEIIKFYKYKAQEFNSELQIIDIQYGNWGSSLTGIMGLIIRMLPNTLCSESVLGFFEKKKNYE